MSPSQTPAPHLAEGALAQQHLLAARVSLDHHVLRPQRWQPRRRCIRSQPPSDIICGGILVMDIAQLGQLELLDEQQILHI